ncbi:uncharacterized protein METZ01_LOCUS462026, partial [marine metagenome]
MVKQKMIIEFSKRFMVPWARFELTT